MADENCFDEELLFTEFEVEKARKKTLKREDDSTGGKSSKSLKEENLRLKSALRSLISMFKVAHGSTTQDPDYEQERYSPLFQAIYFDNRTSIRNREKIEEFVQTLQRRVDDVNERESYGRENFPPSIFDMNYELEKLAEEESYFSPFSVVSSLQYYDVYCIDCCGLPLIDFNPIISDGWVIPKYEQVYFSVLHDEGTQKVKLKQSRACFNCGECGHILQDCPAPQDQEKINANRREFQNKFASPAYSKSRYHCDDKSVQRFSEFKPGIISAKLREALGIGEQDVPFYIYKMRYLGYPPGYLPKEAKPSLLMYDGDGNINDYIEEEDSEDGDKICNSFIEFPGFNIPLPEGVKDISAAIGMPPMQNHQHIDNLAAHYRHQRALSNTRAFGQNNKKRKRTELQRDEQDMDVEEEGGTNALLELGSTESPLKLAPAKRTKYDYKEEDGAQEDNTGYSPSHPGVQYGSEELELLKRYRKHSGSKSMPVKPAQEHTEPNSSTQNGEPKKIMKRTARKSIEEGEVISDDETGDELHEDEDEEAEDDYPETTLGWWLKEPLDPVATTQPKLSPPPKPPVQLPLEALSRFYTKSTVLQKMSFEDRVMWLDPIYGNLQPVSGRYDRLRKLLGNKSAKK